MRADLSQSYASMFYPLAYINNLHVIVINFRLRNIDFSYTETFCSYK